jgi:AcrR family transcriptional regulator
VEYDLHLCYTQAMLPEPDRPATVPKQQTDDRGTLRVDAERNRRHIVDAAREVFAERGLDVPLEAIAQRAGVGIATLYRRFPTREDLIAASFEHKMAEYAAAAEEALQAPDAWSGFCGYLERLCAMQAADRGLRDVLTLTFPTAKGLEAQRAQGYTSFVELVQRAQAGGMLRRDFVPEDLALLLMANAGVVQGTREAVPAAWQRFVALMIDACRADRAHPLPQPPTPAQMYRAMRRLARAPREF